MSRLAVILLLMFMLLLGVEGKRKFCSVMCATRGCDNNDENSCNSRCSSNWIATNGGNSCTPNNANNYYLLDKTANLGGTLTVSPSNVWSSSACSNFQTFGPPYASTTGIATVTLAGISDTPAFFQVMAYLGVISIDVKMSTNWNSATNYYVTMTDGSFSQSNTFLMRGTTKVEVEDYCGTSSSEKQYWNRFFISYAYNTSFMPITWTIYNDQPDTTNLWLLRDFAVVYRICNVNCTACFGATINQCYSCVSTMWLSGTTCNETCLTGYGYQSTPNFCILCDLNCTICYELPVNCSACTTYGTYESFLYSITNQCLAICPSGYFANVTTHTCDLCNTNCTACIYTANYCTACITYFGYANHVCYNPCPVGYYNNTNGTNCTACSVYCYICVDPADLCTVCTTVSPYIAYLYNTTNATGQCLRVCPAGWYPETYSGAGPNLCLACPTECLTCTGNPTPCQTCIAAYYLYLSACINPCPDGYFATNTTGTGTCLYCNTWCVDLTIDMYFPTAMNKQIYIDMQFSRELDFTTFDYQNFQAITISSSNMHYDLSMFTVTYKVIGKGTYRIILEPVGYIFLYNATFTVTTKNYDNTTGPDYSIDLMPFKETDYAKSASLSWFLIKGPPFSELEENVMTSFSTLASKANDFLAKPYVQEIRKSGVFNLLFSGAQITSCSVLSNQIQSQNLYEGVRIWAIFVFFDVPPYEAISNQTKHFVVPTVENQIRNAQEVPPGRSLFSTDSMYWRFQRTGQTTFFIYDCYVPIFLLVVCWILLAVACNCKHKQWYPKHAGKIFSAVHKVHQMSLLYITMASIVEYIYFEPTSTQRIVSAIVCIVFNLYFIVYQLYIYYDMLKYPMARIGNRLYDYYIIRYGSFLKNIRYEEYDINEKWSPKHWFRPYNFHFLSYYKKFLMIITLPLFYETFYAQMAILFFLQIMETLRVWAVWPFLSKKRNWFRMTLQISLALFFLVNIIQINLLQQIQGGDISLMGTQISMFYGFGWAGFFLCFYFNLSYVVIGIYDFCVGLRTSNREKMDEARKKYYYLKIKEYEKGNESANKELVGEWVKLGNLNNNYFGELPEINIRVEEYTMFKALGKMELEVRKISELRMLEKKNHRKKNNTVTRKKLQKKGMLNERACPELYRSLYGVYQKFASNHIEKVIIKTFLNVFQPDFAEGEEVPLNRSHMFQRVELISYDNDRQERQLEEMEEGFPVPLHYFDGF